MASMDRRSTSSGPDLLFAGLFAVNGLFGVLWCAEVASALVCGDPVPHGHPAGAFEASAHAGEPSAAWHAPVGPALVYWTVTALITGSLCSLGSVGGGFGGTTAASGRTTRPSCRDWLTVGTCGRPRARRPCCARRR